MPAELIAADGTVAGYQQHTLWGGTLWRPGGAATPLRFPGQYHDPETGLHYNQQRYYDPVTGSYLTPDPLGLAPAPNPHAYVPNPLTQIDPLGLMSCYRPEDSGFPDKTLVVRGGISTPERFAHTSGATFDETGKVYNVSVNSAPGRSVEDLAEGIPNKQIGVADVGSIRAAGGWIQAASGRGNPYHCLVGGCTPEQFSELFTPTIKNPWK
jgi:RHS repeat-associated protein